MLKPGDLAPEFFLSDENGNEVSLTQLLQPGPIILYFYPADFTLGCTRVTSGEKAWAAEPTRLKLVVSKKSSALYFGMSGTAGAGAACSATAAACCYPQALIIRLIIIKK